MIMSNPHVYHLRPHRIPHSTSVTYLDGEQRDRVRTSGSVPVDFLRPKFRVAHTKDDVISILMQKYTSTNMYIIEKIISYRFILCWDIITLLKLYEKSCRRRKVKIEKILTVTYRTLLTKTTKQNKKCHVLAQILQIEMILHNMISFQFICISFIARHFLL